MHLNERSDRIGHIRSARRFRFSRRLLVVVFATLAATRVDAALFGRLEQTPGAGDYQAYYDDQLNMTWAANASLIGPLNYAGAKAAVEALNIGGVTGWRLPNMDRDGDTVPVDCQHASAAACLDNELGFMAWQNGVRTFAPNPFAGVAAAEYWSTSWATWDPNYVNSVNMQSRIQSSSHYLSERMGWAVMDGDVAAPAGVPEPTALWLVGSGLVALLGRARRNIL